MITTKTGPEEVDADARNVDIDDSSQSAWWQLAHHGSWRDGSLPQQELAKRQENTLPIKHDKNKDKERHSAHLTLDFSVHRTQLSLDYGRTQNIENSTSE